MKKCSIEPATRKDVEEITGKPLHVTVRAFVVKEDNEPLGLIGVHAYQTRLVLFSYIKPEVQKELKRYRRVVIKAYRYIMDILEQQPLPVLSRAEEGLDGSDRLLLHMGFKPYQEGIYEWRGSALH